MNGVWGMSGQPQLQDSDLHIAILSHNHEAFARLIKKGDNVKAMGLLRRTPLHAAVIAKEFDMIATLLAHGADWDARDQMDNTPFESAIANGYTIEEFQQLLRLQPTVILNDGKRNPLHVAAYSGRADLIPYLIDLEVDITARDTHGQTPLIVAVGEGKIEAATVLLEQNADILIQDDEDQNALHMAIMEGDLAMVKILLQHDNIAAALEQKKQDNLTPLSMACGMGDINIIKALVEAGAVINRHDADEKHPLRQAVFNGNPDVVRYLINQGADIEKYQDQCAGNPKLLLAHAASVTTDVDDYKKIIHLLMQAGVDIDRQDINGETALHRAALNHVLDHVETLLAAGANVTMVNNELKSALDLSMPSLNYGHQGETIRLILALIAAGADANMTLADNVALSPLHNAIKYGNADITEALLKAGANPNWATLDKYALTPLLLAAGSGGARDLELLLEKNINLFALTQNEETALHLAAQSGNPDAVRMLLATGLYDLNAKTKDGLTPLHMACANDRASVVEVLLKAGADLDALNAEGEKPLHYAARRTNIKTVLDLFLADAEIAAKIDWNEKSPVYGRTLLHAAVRYGRQEVIDALLELGADPRITNVYGMTPLHNAMLREHRSSVTIHMVRHFRNNYPEELNRTVCPRGWNYIHYAAAVGHVQELAALISAGVDTTMRTAEGDTALHIAARRDHYKMIDYMSAMKKADIDAINIRGETVLGAALRQGYQKSIDAIERCREAMQDEAAKQSPPAPKNNPGPKFDGNNL